MAIPPITSAVFYTAVHRLEQLPREHHPEVAFLGRSNVGKSSLINSLVARHNLVRTSRRPGCTKSINFFLINERWFFVDLPGYGYAAAPQRVKGGWGDVVMAYLKDRKNLAAVVFLHDCRRLPGEEELFLWGVLQSRSRHIIPVLTKADKLTRGERPQQFRRILEALKPVSGEADTFLWFSARTHEGRDQLWRQLGKSLLNRPCG